MIRILTLALAIIMSSPVNASKQCVPKKTVRILSVDGGGIRGIIPIKIMMEIERRLGKSKSITEYFDIMCGTSAGGIIVLMLNIPSEDGRPMYNSSGVNNIFHQFSKSIFKTSMWRKVSNLWGLSGPKYNSDSLEISLNKVFGEHALSSSVKDVMVPSFNILTQRTFLFNSQASLRSAGNNFYMADVARSTSSAPTYFKPSNIENMDKTMKYSMVDGGVSDNNPALSALVYAYGQYKGDANYMVVSIGTGEYSAPLSTEIGNGGDIGWAKHIIPVLMDSVSNFASDEVSQLLKPSNYYRIQIPINAKHASLDDATDDNVAALEKYADDYIKNNGPFLDKIVEGLRK